MRRPNKTRNPAIVLAVTAGIAIAGCGSSGDGETAPPETVTVTKTAPAPAGLTKAQYIAEVDAICAESRAATDRLSRRMSRMLGDAPTDDQVRAASRLYERLTELDRRVGDRIAAVVPAPGYRAQVQPYLDANSAVDALYPSMLEAMRTVDREQAAVVDEQLRDAARDARTAAVAFGFEVCGGQRAGDDGSRSGGEDGATQAG